MENDRLEELFKDALSKNTIQSNPEEWMSIKYKLDKNQFFKFTYQKFNIYYAGFTLLISLLTIFNTVYLITTNQSSVKREEKIDSLNLTNYKEDTIYLEENSLDKSPSTPTYSVETEKGKLENVENKTTEKLDTVQKKSNFEERDVKSVIEMNKDTGVMSQNIPKKTKKKIFIVKRDTIVRKDTLVKKRKR